jgi:hypothetical protein
MRTLRLLPKLIWASPGSLVGLTVGLMGLASGGSWRRKEETLEFWGGAVTSFLENVPLMAGGALAMTLGHVILGINEHALEVTREHELVHVRQYERWGPLFLPAYLTCSAWLWAIGRDSYRDNPFEREAFDRCKP